MVDTNTPIPISAGCGYLGGQTSDLVRRIVTLAEIAAVARLEVTRKNAHWLCPGVSDLPGARRRVEDLGDARLVCFDFDDVDAEAFGRLLGSVRSIGVAGCAWSSWSHSKNPEAVRARLLLALARPASAGEYTATWQRLAAIWQRFGCSPDPAPSKINACFYVGQPMGAQLGESWPFVDDGDPLGSTLLSTVRGSCAWPGAGVPVQAAPVMAPAERLDRPCPARPLDGRGRVHGRARLYVAAVGPTRNTADLWALLAALGDLSLDAGEFEAVAREWIARTGPTRSTGEPYTAREIDKLIRDAGQHRQNPWGSRL